MISQQTMSRIWVFLKQMISQLNDLDKAHNAVLFRRKSYKEMALIIGISESNIYHKN